MEDKQYKPTDNAFTKEIKSDLEHNMEKFRDPMVLGEMLYRLLEERENTNRILKNILMKLEALENKAAIPPTAIEQMVHEPILPEIDEQIVAFIKQLGKGTAEEVRAKFKYKGKNAASARLNRLCGIGVLQKRQVGKKVFFFPL